MGFWHACFRFFPILPDSYKHLHLTDSVDTSLWFSTQAKIFHMTLTWILVCDFHLNWANKVFDTVHVEFRWIEPACEIHVHFPHEVDVKWNTYKNYVNSMWRSHEFNVKLDSHESDINNIYLCSCIKRFRQKEFVTS